MTNSLLVTAASTLLLLCLSSTTSGNTNTVSITHRTASNNNYSSGLNVVKSSHDTANSSGDDEYVTDFYRQKRAEKRELAVAATVRRGAEESECELSSDHSLDHYFDHDAIGLQSRRDDHCDESNNKKKMKMAFFRRKTGSSVGSHDESYARKYNKPAFLTSKKQQQRAAHARSSVASSVRGGSSSMTRQARKHGNKQQRGRNNNAHDYSYSRRNYQRNSHAVFDHDSDVLNNESHDDNDTLSSAAPSSPSQANLLRVPCSLRLNSNDHHHHQHSSSTSSTTSTPIAAYVDTGAQVTVISASAAQKLGILHLIDRRYAGRATGVGHCRVLGRIPAGCVDVMLGGCSTSSSNNHHDSDNNDEEEEDGPMIQMTGPALTVLEGTITEGVDMLLGLDVLQDWEATIQMGKSARQSSIAVKRRGMVEPVVLPFLVGEDDDVRRDGGERRRRRGDCGRRMMLQQRRHRDDVAESPLHEQHHLHERHVQHDIEEEGEIEDDDDLFSPVSSDIESDLDILDQSEFSHEFPDDGSRRVKQCSEKIARDIKREDELLGIHHSHHHHFRDEEDELEASSDEEEEDEEKFDMSGL